MPSSAIGDAFIDFGGCVAFFFLSLENLDFELAHQMDPSKDFTRRRKRDFGQLEFSFLGVDQGLDVSWLYLFSKKKNIFSRDSCVSS